MELIAWRCDGPKVCTKGPQFESGAKGLTVKKCYFENIGFGIYTNNSRSSNFYISDNFFIGRNDPVLIGWSGTNPWAAVAGAHGLPWPPAMGQLSLNQYAVAEPHAGSYIAVKYCGPGHVIQYNYVDGFHDGIDDETYGNRPGSFATDPTCPTRRTARSIRRQSTGTSGPWRSTC